MIAITPTSDRPEAMRLAIRWMERQTRPPDLWVIADDGMRPALAPDGAAVIRRRRRAGENGGMSLARNLMAALLMVDHEFGACDDCGIVIMEDDDWYAPEHIARCAELLTDSEACGCDQLRYHHVADRLYRVFGNRCASLAQTAARGSSIPLLIGAAEGALTARDHVIDGRFWRAVKRGGVPHTLTNGTGEGDRTVVGIKGLPGRTGNGLGWQPDKQWTPDPELARLREWVGEDAVVYERFGGAP